jgi:signal transduction histidine kinase
LKNPSKVLPLLCFSGLLILAAEAACAYATESQSDVTQAVKLTLNASSDVNNPHEARLAKALSLENEIKTVIRNDNNETAFISTYALIDLYTEINNQEGLVRAYNLISSIFRKMSYCDKALEYSFRANALSHKINYTDGIYVSLKDIGFTYERLNRSEEALNYFKQGYNLGISENNPTYIASASKAIARILSKNGAQEEAIYCIQESIKLFTQQNDLNGMSSSARVFAGIYEQSGNLIEALAQYQGSLKYAQLLNEQWDQCKTYVYIGNIYRKMGNEDEALRHLTQGLEIAEKINAKPLQLLVHDSLYKIYTKNEDYRSAATASENMLRLKDEIADNGVQARILDLENVKQLALKQSEIEQLHREKTLQGVRLKQERTYLLLCGSITVLSIILLITLYNRHRYTVKMQKLLKEKSLLIESQNEELTILNATKDRFFSILAHDLQGSVSTLVSSTALLQSMPNAQPNSQYEKLLTETVKCTQRTSALLTNLLEWARIQMKRIHPVAEPVRLRTIVNSIIALNEEFIAKKHIHLFVNIDDRLTVFADEDMIATVFRNLLYNAIKYTPPTGTISIYAIDEGTHIITHIEDTGIGITPKQQLNLFRVDVSHSTKGTHGERGNGLGLIISREFVQQMGGELNFTSIPRKGSDFFFSLPAYINSSPTSSSEKLGLQEFESSTGKQSNSFLCQR